jgi:hypothetical protein
MCTAIARFVIRCPIAAGQCTTHKYARFGLCQVDQRRTRPKFTVAALVATLSFITFAALPMLARAERFEGLSPGQFVVHQQDVPIRIVLIGFGSEVDDAAIIQTLPSTSRPVVRYPRFYGLEGRALGLEFLFHYRVVRKSHEFANSFFAYLKSAGTPGPLTAYQALYNQQVHRSKDVVGPVLYIDAPSVERWLSRGDSGDNERGYSIYLVNWYGRPDFQFHVYTKTDQTDPDTGYNFGVQRHSRKMVSWGGTSSRNWMYDFSAGPEAWGGNFDLDDADLDGDGVADYRIPAIWDYGSKAYRQLSALSGDMGLITRYVAIDLLFAASPLYDPLVTAPSPGGAKAPFITMLEDDPATSGLDFFHKDFAAKRWADFEPYYPWNVGLSDVNPIDAGAKNALDIFSGASTANDCWNAFGTPFAEMFCYFDAHKSQYVPAHAPLDYVGPLFAFNTTADLGGLLGFADDNWVDGTQTYEFVFDGDAYRALGYGFTTTVVHEFGHHLGLSHPHDGYDPETGLDYGPGGHLYFAWLGDESDTIMHYMDTSTSFGRHNQDNMYRYEFAGFLNWANLLADDILRSNSSGEVESALENADRAAEVALEAFQEWDYLKAARNAWRAYSILVKAAKFINVATPRLQASMRLAALGVAPKKEGCKPRPFKD